MEYMIEENLDLGFGDYDDENSDETMFEWWNSLGFGGFVGLSGRVLPFPFPPFPHFPPFPTPPAAFKRAAASCRQLLPTLPSIPNLPALPFLPTISHLPNLPTLFSIPYIPNLPTFPLPSIPAIQTFLYIPNIPTMPFPLPDFTALNIYDILGYSDSVNSSPASSTASTPNLLFLQFHYPNLPILRRSCDASFESTYFESPNVKNDIKELIKQTLVVIRSLVNNDQEPPSSLLKLNMIADKEKGWLLVVKSLVEAVPDEDPLGPAVITLFLDESPLPTREAVGRLLFSFSLNTPECSSQPSFWHRNACIVLGSLAEKLAGASSVSMCTPSVLQYLIKNLNPSYPRQVILFSLIALEKFAQTTENRHIITKALENGGVHPLEDLEQILYDTSLSNDWLAQQVGFCAQWSLDNIFVRPGRVYSYKRTDVSSINAMLNHEDVSEYLKISPDGLEARCDVSSFESVRCTFEVNEGIWYYEATVLTPGVMQIGFATKRSRFLNHEGYGIGDDENSVAYDGCRQLLWHNAHSSRHDHQPWKAGDVVGCLLNLPKSQVIFYLNGKPLTRPHTAFLLNRCSVDGIFAAASFMSFQHCRFNFGNSSFAFPPKGLSFRTFNEAGVKLTDSQKTILPRRCRLEMIQKVAIPDDYCNICYANPADTTLIPCSHGDLCSTCALQLESCPICRSAIFQRNSIPKSSSTQSAPNFGSNDIHTTV